MRRNTSFVPPRKRNAVYPPVKKRNNCRCMVEQFGAPLADAAARLFLVRGSLQ